MEIHHLSITEQIKGLQNGTFTSVDLTHKCLEEIDKRNKELNIFITTTAQKALEMASESDTRRANNALLSPLDGIPITLKDVVCTDTIRTTAASKMLDNYIPNYNATVYDKLLKAGIVLLGKVNTDEFTMGASTLTSYYGRTNNPFDITRTAGGSSGGSAAAVAAYMGSGSIGTDTGGSIRQPASFCGIVGLKPSYGRVSRYGVIPMAPSLDTVGPMGRSVSDVAVLLEVIAGHDDKDATSLDSPVDAYSKLLTGDIKGKKIGLPLEYWDINSLSEDIQNALESTKKKLIERGAELINISLPHSKYAIPAYYIIAPSEISANMSRFDGIRFGHKTDKQCSTLEEIYTYSRQEGLGEEVKRRIMIGTYALSSGYYDAYYKKAQQIRTLIKNDFDTAFNTVDIIFTPTTPHTAFRYDDKPSDPLSMYLEDIFICAANLSGLPALSFPIGTDSSSMPIGGQFIGKFLAEAEIMNAAYSIEGYF